MPSLANIKKTYVHLFFEKDHLLFSVYRKNIFSGKRNAVFPDDTRKIMFLCDVFWKTHLFRKFEKTIIFLVFF